MLAVRRVAARASDFIALGQFKDLDPGEASKLLHQLLPLLDHFGTPPLATDLHTWAAWGCYFPLLYSPL